MNQNVGVGMLMHVLKLLKEFCVFLWLHMREVMEDPDYKSVK